MTGEGMIPEVSIIMPVYNAGPYLKAAMDSILGQSFRNFECILVNDGSTDHSGEIIRTYQDPRIRYIEQANQGVARTLNNALQLARGTYIWRHDADDTCLADKLENQVAFLQAHPEFVLCATQVAFMTEGGKIAMDFRQPGPAYFNGAGFREVNREQFNPYSPITHATVLVRREVLLELGGYRTAFQTGEDVDLWLRLIQRYRAAVINRCDYFVRLNRTSATQVHGWKNQFFRNLAFEYYEQRKTLGKDALERGEGLIVPSTPPNGHQKVNAVQGCTLRADLLDYQLPLHMNAGDWKASLRILGIALKDGWRLTNTWKKLASMAIGKNNTRALVTIKKKIFPQTNG